MRQNYKTIAKNFNESNSMANYIILELDLMQVLCACSNYFLPSDQILKVGIKYYNKLLNLCCINLDHLIINQRSRSTTTCSCYNSEFESHYFAVLPDNTGQYISLYQALP
jgi:hypothetical protein